MYRDSTYIFFNSPSSEENAKEIKGMIQLFADPALKAARSIDW